jgi:hypothetical protein
VLDHQAPLRSLTLATLQSDAPVTHQLRQDVATYIGFAVDNSPNATTAAATVKADCASIGA